jgi:hypothetical protein
MGIVELDRLWQANEATMIFGGMPISVGTWQGRA